MVSWRTLFYVLVISIIQIPVFSQEDYELLFLNHDYEAILQKAGHKSSDEDYYWYASIQKINGNSSEAISVLEEAITRFGNHKKYELLLGQLYFDTGIYTKAKPIFEKYSSLPEMFSGYIQILEFLAEYPKAIDILIPRMKDDSLNLFILSHLGDNYYHLDSIDKALDYYLKAFNQQKEDQSTAYKIVSCFLKKKDYTKSIEVCDIILEKDSTNKKFIKIKGTACYKDKDFEMAESCFSILYNTGDTSKMVLKYLGISELQNLKFHDARKHLLQAFQADSNDFEINFFLGRSYLNSPEPSKSLYYLNRADSLLQPDPMVLSALYIEKQSAYSAAGNYTEAINCYVKAFELNPKPEYLFYIASAYQHKLNDKNKALDYYKVFLSSLPPVEKSEHVFDNNQITISLKKLAEENISHLKEELFFNDTD